MSRKTRHSAVSRKQRSQKLAASDERTHPSDPTSAFRPLFFAAHHIKCGSAACCLLCRECYRQKLRKIRNSSSSNRGNGKTFLITLILCVYVLDNCAWVRVSMLFGYAALHTHTHSHTATIAPTKNPLFAALDCVE